MYAIEKVFQFSAVSIIRLYLAIQRPVWLWRNILTDTGDILRVPVELHGERRNAIETPLPFTFDGQGTSATLDTVALTENTVSHSAVMVDTDATARVPADNVCEVFNLASVEEYSHRTIVSRPHYETDMQMQSFN